VRFGKQEIKEKSAYKRRTDCPPETAGKYRRKQDAEQKHHNNTFVSDAQPSGKKR
jgi:hypothetical protein